MRWVSANLGGRIESVSGQQAHSVTRYIRIYTHTLCYIVYKHTISVT